MLLSSRLLIKHTLYFTSYSKIIRHVLLPTHFRAIPLFSFLSKFLYCNGPWWGIFS